MATTQAADGSTSDTDVPEIDLPEAGLRAWGRFLQAHAVVTRRLEAELEAERDLSLADFDVLMQLQLAAEPLRMSELADRVVLSRSGMTRRVDRLEASGLVHRFSCPSDRRGALVELTDRGRGRLSAAMPVHFRGVREHFLAKLDGDDIAYLDRALRGVAERASAADQ